MELTAKVEGWFALMLPQAGNCIAKCPEHDVIFLGKNRPRVKKEHIATDASDNRWILVPQPLSQ